MEKTAILIPAFNAEETLSELIVQLDSFIPPPNIIVVNDGSTDQTADVAKQHGTTVLHHEKNCGKGKALRTGFEYVLHTTQYDAVVTMDADLQHRPADLPLFFSTRETLRRDLIIGVRKRWGTTMPFARKLSNSITSSLLSARTGMAIQDSQCGFRFMTRELLEAVKTTAEGYEAETEQVIRAAQLGFGIAFVPIQTVYANEKSNMTHFPTTLRFLNVLLKEY